MADLVWDVARLVRVAYLTASGSIRKVIGVNTFLDALPGPTLEIGKGMCRKQWPMPLKSTP